ncbi:MAG: methyltransferase domain-containing protein [Nitrospira sp.]
MSLFITEDQEAELQDLTDRMRDFYRTEQNYSAYQVASHQPALWSEVIRRAMESKGETPRARVLEIGAGRSGFGQWCRTNGGQDIHITSHDINERNREFLLEHSDEFFTGPAEEIRGQWDCIFHSYVLEHVTRPKAFLISAFNNLKQGGCHLFQCPRYDAPFYLPPALDHLSKGSKVLAAFSALASSTPFRIVKDPSVFHLGYYRDRDAIHLVRRRDIEELHRDHAQVSDFSVITGGWKEWLMMRVITMRMVIRKIKSETLYSPC